MLLIDTHFEDKEAGDVGILEAITEDKNLFKMFFMKDLYYVTRIMVIRMKLDELEGARTGRYFMGRSETKETNQFTQREKFGINFRYKHQVENQNNWRHAPIYLEGAWATKLCPD